MFKRARAHDFAYCYCVKEKINELDTIRDTFRAAFWSKCETSRLSDITNINETDVHLDMPPSKVLAVRGGSSKVANLQRHSDPLTAVLGIRADVS